MPTPTPTPESKPPRYTQVLTDTETVSLARFIATTLHQKKLVTDERTINVVYHAIRRWREMPIGA